MQILLHVRFFQKNSLMANFQRKKPLFVTYFSKEYAECQMLFCGQDDVSKTYTSVGMATSFCEFWKFEKPQRSSLCVGIRVEMGYRGLVIGISQKAIWYLFNCEIIGIFRTCTYNHFCWFFFLFFKDYSESYHSYTYMASPEELFTSHWVVFAQRLVKTQLYPVTSDRKL